MTSHPNSSAPSPDGPSLGDSAVGGIRVVLWSCLLAVVMGGAVSALVVRAVAVAELNRTAVVPVAEEEEEGRCLEAGCLLSWLDRGSARQRDGALAEADGIFERTRDAAAAAGLPAVEADAMVRWSGTRIRLEGLSSALALLDSAQTLIDPGDPVRWASVQCQRGGLLAVARSAGADEALASGLALLGVAIDREGSGEIDVEAAWAALSNPGEDRSASRAGPVLAGCLFGLGQSYAGRSRTHGELAITHLRAAADLQQRLGDDYGRAASLQWLASVYRGIGLYPEAVATFEVALEAARNGQNVSAEAWARFGRFGLLSDLGDRASGAADLALARGAMEASGDRFGLTYVLQAEAEQAALEGRITQAAALAELAARALAELGDPRAEVEAIPLRLKIARMAGDSAAVLTLVDELLESTDGGRIPLQVALPAHVATAALLDVGEVDRAARIMEASGDGGSNAWAARYAWEARRAEVAARRGEAASAAAHLDEALEWMSRLRARLYERDLRGGVLSLRSVDLVDPDLGIATVLSVLAEAGMSREAFSFASELRARELEADRIRSLALSPEAVLGLSPPGLRGGTDVAEVRAHLSEGEALLLYETGRRGEPTTLFVVTASDLRTYRLADLDALAPLVNRLASTLAAGDAGEALRRRLGDLLVGPALADLPPAVDHLLIVPSQGLHALPFDALLVPRRANGEGGEVALVERFSVAFLPSPGLLVSLRGAPIPAPTRGVLALGRGAEVGSWGEVRLPRLRWVNREVRRISRLVPESGRRLGRQATAAEILQGGAEGWAVLHVAAHARVDADLPARSALYLAPGPGHDGILHLAELERARLSYPLVVLSACTTAGGREDRGEGLRGLARAFVGAGARTVIASPWPVADRVAARQMIELYRYLAEGLTAAEALAQVKRDAIATGVPPREWAAFRVLGDPSTELPPPGLGRRAQSPAGGASKQDGGRTAAAEGSRRPPASRASTRTRKGPDSGVAAAASNESSR